MSKLNPEVHGRHVLVAAGIALLLVAAAWWWLSEPTDTAVRTAEVTCALRNPPDECDDVGPKRATTGPIVAAIGGGALLLFGVILISGRQRVVYVPQPPGSSPH